MSDPSPIFAADRLSVRYGGFQALADVSWQAAPGRILGIIGPNGAGKSTCFLAATNMVRHAGRLLLDGADVTALPPARLSRLGVRRTFQQNAFFSGLTTLENMVAALGQAPSLALSAAAPWVAASRTRALRASCRAHLERFGIPEAAYDRLPGELSYGTQRMLAVAIACAPDARVVMLDEPGAGLGGADLAALRNLLLRLREAGFAVVLIEHHMDLVMGVADSVLVIEGGRTVAHGTPAAVQTDPRVLEAYLGHAA